LKAFDHWDPIQYLKIGLEAASDRRHLEKEAHEKIIKAFSIIDNKGTI